MNRLLTLLLVSVLAAPALAQVPEMKSSDAKKIAKGVGPWVLADLENDARGRLDGRDDLQKAVEGLLKKYPGAELYRYLDDWGNALAERGGKFPRAKAGALVSDELPNGTSMDYWVPKNYAPKKGGSPLVLWFRSGALSEDDLPAIPAAIQDDFAVVAVPVPSGSDEEVLAALRSNFFIGVLWLTRQLRIDRDRVYVVADGSDAAAAARMCALAPHVAAGAALAGDAGDAPAGNLSLLTVENVDGLDAAWEWVAQAEPRASYPTEFEVELSESQFGRIFWVQAMRFDPSLEGKPATLKVKADRAANRIEIEATNVYQVDLFLNDQIVDLSKPFVIVRNGQEIEVSTSAGFMTLLENYKVMLEDNGAIFPAKYKGVDIPPAGDASTTNG